MKNSSLNLFRILTKLYVPVGFYKEIRNWLKKNGLLEYEIEE